MGTKDEDPVVCSKCGKLRPRYEKGRRVCRKCRLDYQTMMNRNRKERESPKESTERCKGDPSPEEIEAMTRLIRANTVREEDTLLFITTRRHHHRRKR